MISQSFVLYFDSIICFGFSLLMMFSSETLTKFYFNIEHNQGIEHVAQLFGSVIFGLSWGLCYIARTTSRAKELMLRMRSVSWFLVTLFVYLNKTFYKSETFNLNLMVNLMMFVLTTTNANWFASDNCCDNYKRCHGRHKMMSRLKWRAFKHPTVHDGYKSD